MYGPDNGIGLRAPHLEQLRYRLVSVLLENLDDPENEDPAVLAETFFGPGPTGEQHNLVGTALEALLDSRRHIQSARSEE